MEPISRTGLWLSRAGSTVWLILRFASSACSLLLSLYRTSRSSRTPSSAATGDAGDDDVEDGHDTVDDGLQSCSDGVDDSHEGSSDCAEHACDLPRLSEHVRQENGRQLTYARDDGAHVWRFMWVMWMSCGGTAGVLFDVLDGMENGMMLR